MHHCSFEELRKLALSKRGAGTLTIEFETLRGTAGRPESVADDFSVRSGFKPLGKAWRFIERPRALDSAFRVLACDLAYQHPLMDRKTARYIAESFLGLFSPYKTTFCTNGSFDEKSMLEWTPITEATFDHGIVAFDENHIGMLWVQDED